MLKAERNPDNRHAQQQPEHHMDNAKFNAANQYPNDIPKRAHNPKAAGCYITPERPKYKTRDLKALYAKRYANNSHAQQKADDRPQNRGYDSSKNKPKQVS